MSARTVTFADLETLVGHEIGVSDWFTIDQERVNRFADATQDHQWIHIDVERATRELGGPIAHGFLTLSLLPMFSAQILHVTGIRQVFNYGSDKVRFTNPVPVGSRVRARQTCMSVTAKPAGKQMISQTSVEIEGRDKPALVAETISLFVGM